MTGRFTFLTLIGVLIAGGPAAGGGFGPGGDIYDRYCANCHGFDGVPNLPGTPDFSRGEGLQNIDAALINAIRFGVRSMPGFDQTINKEELIDVVFYIRTLQR
jgi:mono/diheme cytochrome c family protein